MELLLNRDRGIAGPSLNYLLRSSMDLTDYIVENSKLKAGDEKRTPVIIQPEPYNRWLGADIPTAEEMMTWVDMPVLTATAQPRMQ
jgi:hypothetical protein